VQHPIRLFAAAMFKHWWELMSCAAFTILGVYIAATDRGNGWVVGGIAFLAAVFFVLAAYRTWRDEHHRYIGEVARNHRPDIWGEAFNFSGYGIHGEGHEHGHCSADCNVTFEIYVCNHNPITTTLKAVEVDGSRLTPPVNFDFRVIEAVLREPAFPVGMEMPHGMGKTMKVHATATVDGMRLAEIPPIVMDAIQIHIVDAFEHKHPIRVKQGERLIFGER
jgi:hypothetical protein